MIDIDRLRQLAQATNEHSDDRAEILAESYAATQSDIIIELLDRLEAAESECLEQARLNGMGASREAALLAKLEAAEENRSHFLVKIGKLYAQCDALQAKIEQMEKQTPREAIEKMLTELMDIAVSNGANSVSMPDEYVEVAAWLCGIPVHTATSAPENYFGMTLHDKIEAMENKL